MHNLTWTREPVTYHSMIGTVWRDDATLDWLASVQVGDKVYRLDARYDSVPVAMAAVERTWEREKAKIKAVEVRLPKLGEVRWP